MPHDTPLIATIVAGLGLAFVFGAIANRFRIPPLVGYLVAGVLVGPNTPGFVADTGLANELAEIGVILLMFGVGLHFSLKDLLSVRAIAVPGFLVIEDADKTLAKLRDDGIETVSGNAASSEVFSAANPEGASRLILAIPNAFEAGQIVLRARAANPKINVIARAHSDAEVEHLKGLGADTVIMGEREIARGIVEEVLAAPKAPSAA
ncbi:NAD-binding protein [Mesorhizobium muleiense]|uniref:NAD-binding protein n=1 Tax=Mesorhizobium muleiense TaxID=1004279 RepID=UPI003AFA7B3A